MHACTQCQRWHRHYHLGDDALLQSQSGGYPDGDSGVNHLSSEWIDRGGDMSPVSRRWSRLTPACLLETVKGQQPRCFPGCKEEMQMGRSAPRRSMDIDSLIDFCGKGDDGSSG
ncbi:unnamed protein product [Pleuronectes platessa]|uniref:Uncharacterized protein n=1 Tax=Pleuronectes platessa TaxID=8262 RepID=A0A9N7VDF3_PLEPL|nr:unnamed protein product [Pleuronectes platessa]